MVAPTHTCSLRTGARLSSDFATRSATIEDAAVAGA